MSLDLDAFEDEIHNGNADAMTLPELDALISELRAARKVVEAARKVDQSSREFACDYSFGPPDSLRLAWMIYDEAVAELSSINDMPRQGAE